MAGRVTCDRETFIEIIGEGIHTGFRKGAGSPEAGAAHRAIAAMPDWDGVLEFLVGGLELMGVLAWEDDGDAAVR